MPTATYTHIATATATGSSPNILVSSIPSTYTNLYIVAGLRSSDGRAGGQSASVTFSGDTAANYFKLALYADNTSNGAFAQNNVGSLEFSCAMNGGNANSYFVQSGYILQYKNTNMWKTVLWRGNGGFFPSNQLQIGYWRSTSAVTSINIQEPSNLNWVSGSYLSVYGMVGA